MAPKIKDISGQRFGRLTVISIHSRTGHGEYKWLCQCDCGKEVIVRRGNLISGQAKSCGCLKAECKPPVHIKHGYSRLPIYKIWQAMKDRCKNKSNKFYAYYGGRGITFCEAWENPINFIDWANSNGYEKGLDLDRRNNDLGYSPDNCRFIPHSSNLMNTRRKILVNFQGNRIPLALVAKNTGIPYKEIYQEYKNGKWGDNLAS